MILYIFVAVATVMLGMLVNNHGIKQNGAVARWQALNVLSLGSVFLILFALSACRLNVGNDYAKYVEFMHLVSNPLIRSGIIWRLPLRYMPFPMC